MYAKQMLKYSNRIVTMQIEILIQQSHIDNFNGDKFNNDYQQLCK